MLIVIPIAWGCSRPYPALVVSVPWRCWLNFSTSLVSGLPMSLQTGFYSLLVQSQMGHIIHAGNDRARTALMESLWLVVSDWKRPSYEMQVWGYQTVMRWKKCHGGSGKEFSIRSRRMLLDHVPYEIYFQKGVRYLFTAQRIYQFYGKILIMPKNCTITYGCTIPLNIFAFSLTY
jgi:hypothetical protein